MFLDIFNIILITIETITYYLISKIKIQDSTNYKNNEVNIKKLFTPTTNLLFNKRDIQKMLLVKLQI